MTALLEREGDLAALDEALSDASQGHGGVVVVAGEAGIGKSSLVRAFAEAHERDARLLVGWCDDFLTRRTLGPLHDVARSAGGALAEAVARSDTAAVLDSLMALLRDPLRPTALILEDVHWADDATLDVVRYLGRRIASLPAVMVVTYRGDDTPADHPLRAVLGVLPSTVVRRIDLRRLTRAAVTRLAEGTDLDAAEIARVTAGNPFFVTELVRTADGLPTSVSDAVMSRVRGLPRDAREAIELVAVIPRPVALEDARALVPDVRALATAEDRGLLVSERGAVRFAHELVRTAVLAALPSALRQEHHRAVLDHLLATRGDRIPGLGSDVEPGRADLDARRGHARAGAGTGDGALLGLQHDRLEVLHHADRLGRGELIARFGPAAAHDAFLAGAYRQAIDHQDAVLRHVELVDPGAAALLFVERAWSLYNLHRFDGALDAAEEAVERYAAMGDAQAECRARLTRSRMRYLGNRLDEAFEDIAAARVLLPDCEPFVQAELEVNELSLLQLADRHAEVLAVADAVLARAEASERSDLVAHTLNYRGGSRVLVGQVDAGLADLRRSVEIAGRAGWVEAAARASMNLAELLVVARRWTELDEVVRDAIELYDDYDLISHRLYTLSQQALASAVRGDWRAATEAMRRAEEGLRRTGADTSEVDTFLYGGPDGALVRLVHALVAVRTGDDDPGASVERAWEAALASGSAHYLVPVACLAVEHAWAEERPEWADRFVAPALEAARETSLAAQLQWRLPLLGREPTAGRDGSVPPSWPEPERTSLAGDGRRAAAGWAELDMPFERGLELLRLGAADACREALECFTGIGAEPAARRARQVLRELGVTSIPRGPQAATRENPAQLTDRQLEVLQLLTEGLTNAEIADRLVVSVRTVDHHVSAVLQKLAVGTRQEAAERARELGVGP